MGHESSGTVEALGPDVTSLKARITWSSSSYYGKVFSVQTLSSQVGDRVALEPGVPCSKCRACSEGRYNLCKVCMHNARRAHTLWWRLLVVSTKTASPKLDQSETPKANALWL